MQKIFGGMMGLCSIVLPLVAHSSPTVYGKVYLTLDNVTTDYALSSQNPTAHTTSLSSQLSRIGIKGEEPLVGDTSLIYQLEYGVDIDTDDNHVAYNGSPQWYARNTFLGVKNPYYGTLLAGKNDTPFRMSKGGVDVYYPHNDLNSGKVGVAGEVRANNLLEYISPTFHHTVFTTAYGLAEQHNNPNPHLNKNSTSSSLVYDNVGKHLGLAYDTNMGTVKMGTQTLYVDKAWRASGSVNVGKLTPTLPSWTNGITLGGMLQQAQLDDIHQTAKSQLISLRYLVPNTAWTVKGQYIGTQIGDWRTHESVMGADYAWNKNTMMQVYAGNIAIHHDTNKKIVGMGMEYKF